MHECAFKKPRQYCSFDAVRTRMVSSFYLKRSQQVNRLQFYLLLVILLP